MGTKSALLQPLCDLDQPFLYEIRMYNRPYRFEFYDTDSPADYKLLHPDLALLCYDISHRRSLDNVQQVWRKDVTRHYSYANEKIPVMLVGLKRDLRVEEEGMIHPQEVRRPVVPEATVHLLRGLGISDCAGDAL